MYIDLEAKDLICMDGIIGFQRVVLGVHLQRDETLFSILAFLLFSPVAGVRSVS